MDCLAINSAVALTNCCSLHSMPGRNLHRSLTSCWSWDEIVFLYVTCEVSLTDCWPQDKVRRNNIKCHSHSVGHSMRLSVRFWKCHSLPVINEMRDDEPQESALLLVLTFWHSWYRTSSNYLEADSALLLTCCSGYVPWWGFLVCSVTHFLRLFIIWCGEILW